MDYVYLNQEDTVKEYLNVMEENGCYDERSQVKAFVDVCDLMTRYIGDLTNQIVDMQSKLQLMEDKTLKRQMEQVVKKVDDTKNIAKRRLESSKKTFMHTVKDELNKYAEYGKSMIGSVSKSLHLKDHMISLSKVFNAVKRAADNGIDRLTDYKNRGYEAKEYLRGAKSVLKGEEFNIKERVSDKGILHHLQTFLFGVMGKCENISGTLNHSAQLIQNFENMHGFGNDIEEGIGEQMDDIREPDEVQGM